MPRTPTRHRAPAPPGTPSAGRHRPAPHRPVTHRHPGDRTAPDRTTPDRAVPDQGLSGRTVPDRAVPDRTVPDRTVPDRAVPDRSRPGHGLSERPAPPGGRRRSPGRPVADRPTAPRRAPVRPAAPVRPRRAPAEPQDAVHLVLSGIGGLIVAAICGLLVFFVVAEERQGPPAVGVPAVADGPADRRADARPLTVAEVFPAPWLSAAPGVTPYAVAGARVNTDCAAAAAGELRDLLEAADCGRVVRAALTAPHGGYPVTAGVVDLPDVASAQQVRERLRRLVESGEGTFVPLAPAAAAAAPGQVAWQTRGHYLVYAVIGAPGGAYVGDADPHARRITAELVEGYLATTVLGRRAASAAASPAPA